MLILSGTAHRLRVQLAVTATVHVHASWADKSAGTVTPGATNTVISSTSLTDVVGGPASSVQRNVRLLTIRNVSATPVSVAILHYDGTTSIELHVQMLAPGGQIHYSESTGFQLSTQLPRAGIHGAVGTGPGLLILPSVNATALTVTGAQAANRLDAIPFIPARDLVIDQLALETTTLFAGGLFKLAIYADAGTGRPGTLLVGTGNLTTDATGYKEEAIATTPLTAGTLYWLAAHYSSATQAHRAVALAAAYPFAAPAVSGTAQFTLWRVTSTFGSGLPASFPTPTATSAVIPAIRLRTV